MNLQDASGVLRKILFKISRVIMSIFPGRRIPVFGSGPEMIGSIVVRTEFVYGGSSDNQLY